MRKIPLLWLLLAAICGGVLFHTSQQVNDGRQRLAVINDDIRKEDETIRVLQAEWGYLNQPDRLEKLSKQYLNLAPLQGKQFTKLQQVADRPAPPTEPAAATTGPATTVPATTAAPVAAAAPPVEAPAGDAPAAPPAPKESEAATTATATEPVPVAEIAAVPPETAEAPRPAAVKPAPVKTASVKHAPAKAVKSQAPRAFIVGARLPPAPKHAAPVATADRMEDRSFGDVMKSLGVH